MFTVDVTSGYARTAGVIASTIPVIIKAVFTIVLGGFGITRIRNVITVRIHTIIPTRANITRIRNVTLTILMMTGYAAERQRAHNLDVLIHQVISKPFSLEQICDAVDEALKAA